MKPKAEIPQQKTRPCPLGTGATDETQLLVVKLPPKQRAEEKYLGFLLLCPPVSHQPSPLTEYKAQPLCNKSKAGK